MDPRGSVIRGLPTTQVLNEQNRKKMQHHTFPSSVHL